MKKYTLTAVIVSLLITGCGLNGNKTYEKQAVFKDKATLKDKIEIAANITPTAQQIQRQNMELAALLPFGINTYTGREWGTGNDDLDLFNPENFDADQWIKTLKDNGFELAILTAKHHDGFCLWPTKTNTYSVTFTPWKNGQGDVVAEVKKACDKYGLKFGLYLSMWDRHADTFGTEAYNDYLTEQLTELLTNYGDIYELWLDGSFGEDPSFESPVYDFDKINSTIKKLQPTTLVSMMGEDLRWVGNEQGASRNGEWSVTALVPPSQKKSKSLNSELTLDFQSADLGSRDLIEKSHELHWYPAEMNVSIRPSWFYREEEDLAIKSVADLVNVYIKSVGNNSLLLLSIPPNKDGLISQYDADRLSEFANYLTCYKNNNLVINPTMLNTVNPGDTIHYSLPEEQNINTLLLQEDLEHGQRTESFLIEAKLSGQWEAVYNGSTIGQKRIIRLPKDLLTKEFRLIILQARSKVFINKLGAYNCEIPTQDFSVRVLNEFSSHRWKMIKPSEEGESIIDDNITTYWYGKGDLIIDLGREEEFGGIIYTPAFSTSEHINIFSFAISDDNLNWVEIVTKDEFANIKNNPTIQKMRFSNKYRAKYIKLTVHKSANFNDTFSIAELGLLK